MKNIFKTYFFTLSFIFILAGCGFQPMYGKFGGVEADIAKSVAVDTIASRQGQILRNLLLDQLSYVPTHKPMYRLVVQKPSRSVIGMGIDRTSESETRVQLLMTADFSVVEDKTDMVLLKSSSRGFVAYNVLDSQYESITAREDAEKRALNMVAEDIVRQTILFLQREQEEKAKAEEALTQ